MSIPKNKQKISLYLELEQIQWLLEYKKKTGSPIAETIRRAVDEYQAKKT